MKDRYQVPADLTNLDPKVRPIKRHITVRIEESTFDWLKSQNKHIQYAGILLDAIARQDMSKGGNN